MRTSSLLETPRVESFAGEELPMTLIVAMVGTDGIVIAADRKRLADTNAATTSSLAAKGFVGKAKNAFAVASGQEVALYAAKQIAAEMDGAAEYGKRILELERIGRECAQSVKAVLGHGSAFHGEVIAVFADDKTRIYRMRILPDRSIADDVSDKAISGDAANSAVFFAERHYSRRPIKELTLLSAHSVLMAGELDPRGIAGLDVWHCREQGVERIATDSLVARSQQIDGRISAMLLAREG